MEIKERMRLTRWAADMAECQNSGLTQAQWCELRGISLKTFEHRCKRVRDKVSESIGETDPSLPPPAFAELPADVMKNAQDSSLGMGIADITRIEEFFVVESDHARFDPMAFISSA